LHESHIGRSADAGFDFAAGLVGFASGVIDALRARPYLV
jgi:hypothetical protein